MKVSADQKKTVASWLKAGASIAEVQRRLREEFQISLTYMDTRFLIDDLGLNLAPPPPPPKASPPTADLAADAKKPAPKDEAVDAEYLDEDEAFDEAAEFAEPATPETGGKAASVKVEVDRLTRPGTVVSGSVTFSDGKSGSWALDQFGRLIFEAKTAGYRPSQADLQAFQRELSSQLQRHGY